MNRKLTSSFLDQAIALLVEHFGANQVRATLAKISNSAVDELEGQVRQPSRKTHHKANPSITSILKQIQQKDELKYLLLSDFYTRLKERNVLPDSQDIRQFAQVIGLKEIRGKSREDTILTLMRFLLEQPTERLQSVMKSAANVSEQQRQQGFSILTDKLLGR